MFRTRSYPYGRGRRHDGSIVRKSAGGVPGASQFDAMQKIAGDLKLTETAFALPATREDCAARLRIFTPVRELAFAGHPTVGAAFVLLQKQIIA